MITAVKFNYNCTQTCTINTPCYYYYIQHGKSINIIMIYNHDATMNGNKTEIISNTITITSQHAHEVTIAITIIKQCGEIPVSFVLTALLFKQ